MVTRRKYLSGIATASVVSTAGCLFEGPKVRGNFEMLDIGLVEKGGDIAAFIEVKNIDSQSRVFVGWLATYDSDGVRVSDWHKVSDEVQAGTRRRLYVVFESGDSGWADTNDIGQVVDSHTAKFRQESEDRYEPTGTPIGNESSGETL